MSRTHYDGQRLATHDCGRSVRLAPERSPHANGRAWCGRCSEPFEVS